MGIPPGENHKRRIVFFIYRTAVGVNNPAAGFFMLPLVCAALSDNVKNGNKKIKCKKSNV